MSGYCGYSMSWNAVEAYESGRKPLSKWKKADILCAIAETFEDEHPEAPDIFRSWNTAELKTLLYCSEWHHTGNGYQRTDFYGLDEDAVMEYISGKEKPVIKAAKRALEIGDGYYHGKYKETEWHPYARRNKHAIHYVPFENAKRKGAYLILPDGKKKKYENCIELVQTKNKRRIKKKPVPALPF